MVVGDRGWFRENYALEFVGISWECYHNPYAYPHETTSQMDGCVLRKFKNGCRL